MAFSIYLEAVSVIPQLRFMQNAKVASLYSVTVFCFFICCQFQSTCFNSYVSRWLKHLQDIMYLLLVFQDSWHWPIG